VRCTWSQSPCCHSDPSAPWPSTRNTPSLTSLTSASSRVAMYRSKAPKAPQRPAGSGPPAIRRQRRCMRCELWKDDARQRWTVVFCHILVHHAGHTPYSAHARPALHVTKLGSLTSPADLGSARHRAPRERRRWARGPGWRGHCSQCVLWDSDLHIMVEIECTTSTQPAAIMHGWAS
jgi:hypothetical protein